MSNSQEKPQVSSTEAPKTPAPASAPQQEQGTPKPAEQKPNEQQK